MNSDTLTDDMRVAGGAVLDLSATLGMRSIAAAWLYNSDLGEWRYYLVTALVDELGRAAIYQRLADGIRATGRALGLDVIDIYICAPADPVARTISSLQAHQDPGVLAPGDTGQALLYISPHEPVLPPSIPCVSLDF